MNIKSDENMKNIKYIILGVALVGLCFACSGQLSGTKIKIEAKNYGADTIGLTWRVEREFNNESLKLVNGKAEIEVNVPEETQFSLVNYDPFHGSPRFYFYAEKGTITISFDGEKWPELTIKGGHLSNDMNRYWKEMGPLAAKQAEVYRRHAAAQAAGEAYDWEADLERVQKEQNRIQGKFIDENPNSALAFDLLTRRITAINFDAEGDLNDIDRFDKQGAELKASPKGIEAAARIAKVKNLLPGNPAPPFVKIDKNGNSVSLANYNGKYVLVAFWGTWCSVCRKTHPHLVELYNKYTKLGLEFISVAQEGGTINGGAKVAEVTPKWLKGIADDGLVWTQILNDEGQNEYDLVKLYNITAFPSKILIDPQGKIVAKWLGYSHGLPEKLGEIFGQ